MKKIIFLVLIALLTVPVISSAHPGGTDSSGCHTCRTNCSSWGLSNGEYHCHNNKGTPQPENPIHSVYGSGGTGYTVPAPDYEYGSYSYTSTPSIPSCPSMSTYDSLSGNCKCISGYVVSVDTLGKESCVSATTKCHDILGYGSKYNSLTNKCECSFGYLFDGNSCVYASSYCSKKFGTMSTYDSLTENCKCLSGYSFNGNSCVSYNEICQNEYGVNSYGDSSYCYCDPGYKFDENKICIKVPEVKAVVYTPTITPEAPAITPKSPTKPEVEPEKASFSKIESDNKNIDTKKTEEVKNTISKDSNDSNATSTKNKTENLKTPVKIKKSIFTKSFAWFKNLFR